MIIRELRGKETQQQLAEALNLKQRTISSYENGTTEPDIKTLCKLADHFGVSLDYLCGRQFNNNIGYVPDEKKDGVIQLLKLNGKEFEKAAAYITALLDIKE